jgi:hypothetical protein
MKFMFIAQKTRYIAVFISKNEKTTSHVLAKRQKAACPPCFAWRPGAVFRWKIVIYFSDTLSESCILPKTPRIPVRTMKAGDLTGIPHLHKEEQE